MIYIITLLLIIALTVTAIVAKRRSVRKATLIALLVVLAIVGAVFVLLYAHVMKYSDRYFWPPLWALAPFLLLGCAMVAVVAQLRKLR